MAFRSYRIRIAGRIILTGLFMAFMFYALEQEKWYVATGVSALIVILLMIDLFRFIDRSNREFTSLLEALKHQDFTQSYSRKFAEKSFRELESSFNEILEQYRGARMDQAAQYQYLQTVIEHINIALVCFNNSGKVFLFNQAAAVLFRKAKVESLEPLKSIHPTLHQLMVSLRAGQREVIRVNREGELLQLSVHVTEFRVRKEKFKLVSLQNIRHELEEQELDSWQKLIRVLTHEIMNSVTPVSSLSSAINEMLTDEEGRRRALGTLSRDDLDDLYSSLDTIEERSRGLLSFVADYKNLTRLPQPLLEDITVEFLLNHMHRLFKKDMASENINYQVQIPAHQMSICADSIMIQQVLINLIKNAMEALKESEEKSIMLSADSRNEKVIIRVRDNGKGIDDEDLEKVFIPFYTTKKKGSGIGLSLSKQIMRLHKGSIHFQSDDSGTVFNIEF
ncbi:MAG: GHKL domain-containing protein [Bacteroidales bacterium]|nr:GHKL domain-containing protein [Bacteroidales bacterium]